MRLIRFLFRLAATIALALAVVSAVEDAARSVASSSVEWTPLLLGWQQAAPLMVDDVAGWISDHLGAPVWNGVVRPLLSLPGWVVFGLVAILFYVLGRQPAPKRGRIARPA